MEVRSFATAASAATTYGTGSRMSTGTYNKSVSSKLNGIYYVTTVRNSYVWNLYCTSKPLVRLSHTKGGPRKSRTLSRTVSASTTKTSQWNVNASTSASMKANATFLESSISSSVSSGYGESYAQGYSYSATDSITLTLEPSDKSGEYMICPGYKFYKMKSTWTNTRNGDTMIIYYDVPYYQTEVCISSPTGEPGTWTRA